jgi:glycine dehydrogenase subunit 1
MRYLPLSAADRAAMLSVIGIDHIDALYADVPQGKLLTQLPELAAHQGEMRVAAHMRQLAGANLPASSAPFFLGAGAYRHHVPATVDHLVQRSEFLTAYTPYQPEISQGTLQVLFEFQTQVGMLTGMEVANASMYDGSTAAAEAVLMARRVTRRGKTVISGSLHPHYREVIETTEHFSGGALDLLPPAVDGKEDLAGRIDKDTAAVVVQYPDFFGNLNDFTALADAAHAAGALLVVVVTEIVALGAIRSPGEMGADIVAAEGQSLGCGLNFGGPYVGLFATRQKYVRSMPGRLCGETIDADGKRGFVLTLSTREQHIRREKATSNICTNSGLMALAFSIHLSLLGEAGLRQLAALNHQNAVRLATALGKVKGVKVLNDSFFNELTVRVKGDAAALVDKLAGDDILAGVPVSRLLPGAGLDDLLLVATSELTSDDDIATLAAALG